MKNRLFIFDLDGTIIDTLKDISKAVNFSLEKNGFNKRSEEEIRSFLGYGSKKLICSSIGKKVDNRTFKKVFDDYFNFYKNHPFDSSTCYDGIIKILLDLKKNNAKLALLTNKPKYLGLPIIKHFFGSLFDIEVYQTEDIKPKPSNEGVNLILSTLNISKEETTLIGDSKVDYETSLSSEIKSIIVTYGYENKNIFKDMTKATIVNSTSALQEVILL